MQAFGWSSHWLRVAESNANEPNVESMVNFYYEARIYIYIFIYIYIYEWPVAPCNEVKGQSSGQIDNPFNPYSPSPLPFIFKKGEGIEKKGKEGRYVQVSSSLIW